MNEDEDRAAYWDWVLETFGPGYYMQARYMSHEEAMDDAASEG